MKPWILLLLAGLLILATQLITAKTTKQLVPPKDKLSRGLESGKQGPLFWTHPSASPVFPVKPGECPLVKVPADYPCDQECVWDSDCKGDKKCCPAGCARECFPPGPH
ncbi:waprin-Phi3-like isoform X1 [Crotalus tigris]|uniref:waprin-Phi3-like isoform X1 n=1 Tax=Crotalus tigris TaxID=88082 RepID=UPI00192F7586|nr:waprin-Phi3-like isoform X1 [Crotalus tigris]